MDLEDIARLGTTLNEANADVEQAERILAQKKQRVMRLVQDTIPCAMQEIGISEVKLDTGQKLKIKEEVQAKINNADKVTAFNWLEEHEYDGIIKTTITVSFNKDEMQRAVKLYDALQKKNYNLEFGRSIHSGTLKAFVRERMASGEEFPADLFGAFPYWVAKIK
jgi:hypothetical protein